MTVTDSFDPTSAPSPAATVSVTPASATRFVVSGFPSSTTAGIANSATVTAYDAYGNEATGYTGTVAITSSDSQAVLPANAGLTYGVGSFTVTLETAGTQSITATDTMTNSITGSQIGITVTAAGLDHIVISPVLPSTIAGVPQAFTTAAFDQYGNSLGDVTASTTFNVNSNPITGNSVSENLVGSYMVTATYNGKSDSTTLTVTAAALDHIMISPATASITAKSSQAYSATAFDAYGNSWDITATYGIDAGAGGTWSDNIYSSANTGVWTVTGTYATKTATAQLTVNTATAPSNTQTSQTYTSTSTISKYTIIVTQTANGKIAPGTTTVNYGASQTFTITPNNGYYITSITTDTGSVTVTSPAGQTVSFTNVQADHTLTAKFAVKTYAITVFTGAHGTVTPGNETVNSGTALSFTITPDIGYHVANVIVNGTSVGTVTSYNFTATGATSISASFAINTVHAITLNLILIIVIIVVAIILTTLAAMKRRKQKPNNKSTNPQN